MHYIDGYDVVEKRSSEQSERGVITGKVRNEKSSGICISSHSYVNGSVENIGLDGWLLPRCQLLAVAGRGYLMVGN